VVEPAGILVEAVNRGQILVAVAEVILAEWKPTLLLRSFDTLLTGMSTLEEPCEVCIWLRAPSERLHPGKESLVTGYR
jgi:hypothetical protein